ncbi:MAG: hypothetical protein QMD01_02620 [Thermodesulfovibrionales bacterium]|nr:hypothetical protein [Thermodesulfovibrionales bacterium]
MKHKKNRFSKKNSSASKLKINIGRFALVYLILMGAFFLLIGLKPIQDVIDLNGIYTKGVVIVTSAVLEAIGIHCTYQGSIIRLPSISLDPHL